MAELKRIFNPQADDAQIEPEEKLALITNPLRFARQSFSALFGLKHNLLLTIDMAATHNKPAVANDGINRR